MTFVVIFNFRQPPNEAKPCAGCKRCIKGWDARRTAKMKAQQPDGCEHFIKPSNEADRLLDAFYLRTAAIPGSSIPSKYSSIAPPPVET